MGASQRRKGHNFEREIARRLGAAFGVEARRGLQARDGGAGAPDVILPGIPVHVECKVGARPNVFAALEQAIGDAHEHEGLTPVAIVRRDRGQAIVVMELERWINWMCMALELRRDVRGQAAE